MIDRVTDRDDADEFAALDDRKMAKLAGGHPLQDLVDRVGLRARLHLPGHHLSNGLVAKSTAVGNADVSRQRAHDIAFGQDADDALLGIGDDGHTASLFPGTEALSENTKLVTANFVPKLNTYRLTMTYRLINTSHNICFLVNDTQKENIVQEILNGNTSYPAAGVHATESLTWIIGN